MSRLNVSVTVDQDGNQIVHNGQYPGVLHDPRYPYGVVNNQYHQQNYPVGTGLPNYPPQQVMHTEIPMEYHTENRKNYQDLSELICGIPASWIVGGLFVIVVGLAFGGK